MGQDMNANPIDVDTFGGDILVELCNVTSAETGALFLASWETHTIFLNVHSARPGKIFLYHRQAPKQQLLDRPTLAKALRPSGSCC